MFHCLQCEDLGDFFLCWTSFCSRSLVANRIVFISNPHLLINGIVFYYITEIISDSCLYKGLRREKLAKAKGGAKLQQDN